MVLENFINRNPVVNKIRQFRFVFNEELFYARLIWILHEKYIFFHDEAIGFICNILIICQFQGRILISLQGEEKGTISSRRLQIADSYYLHFRSRK